MFYTYVLRSRRDGHLYIGMSGDLSNRVRAHNSGKVRSTKGRRPLDLVYYESYRTKAEARIREIFLKSGQGREYLKTKIVPVEG